MQTKEAGEKLASGSNDRVLFVHTDVTDEGSVAAAIEAAQSAFGSLPQIVRWPL